MDIFLSNQSKSDQGDSSVPPIRLVSLVTPTLKCFKLTDLRKATQNFKTDSQLGEYVYKGWIDNQSFKPSRPGAGVAVFVKHQRGFDDEAEWMDKLNFLGNIHHPNIMRLIGYCSEGDQRLLVSEYMIRGNLEKHLFGVNKCSLSWSLRFKIVLGVAKGLAFLHRAVVEGGYEADFNPSKVCLIL
ncbi:putative serine/threonine-protein kinase PBL4 [Bidens hawaiensis]|uniref:putative serine/threonine-protein kinase PBL4 n=1 Tax=Bidens hawaiensis TaxID=980011 RepID=UPI00404A88C3